MALIKCPECGSKVSDTASVCVKCGFKINKPVERAVGSVSRFGQSLWKEHISRAAGFVARSARSTWNLHRTVVIVSAAVLAAAILAVAAIAVAGGQKHQSIQAAKPLKDERDGRKYKAVKVGGYTWMAENLNYETDGSWCYDSDKSNCKRYGGLYDWNTAKSVCPPGWRLPSRAEWNNLVTAAGGWESGGKRLKSTRGWGVSKGSGGSGSDSVGFAALPGGYRYTSGNFNGAGTDARWWSSAEKKGGGAAYYRGMRSTSDSVYKYNGYKSLGYSVRCVRD
ncbi:MAG: zinc-ribbon domain-containing protein [Chitinispirillales bacterium]|jgi:uncharacterized protein (TIGR02145 family)|nr:zinc-ribbon domain-containing protein [Chitinispirillales bacterium]